MTPFGSTFLIFIIASFLASFTLTWLMGKIGRRFGWVARPSNDRWHKKPIALHGGVAFCVPLFISSFLWILLESGVSLSFLSSFHLHRDVKLAFAALAGAGIIFLCGLWDDIKQLNPITKLIVQFAATSIFVFFGSSFQVTGFESIDLLITYFWFVGITNAINMLDNMDGLSSGAAIIAASSLLFIALWPDGSHSYATYLGTILAACLLGFWLHNRHPASIFMGDSGSMTMGFLLAALTIPSSLNGYLGIMRTDSLVQGLITLLAPACILAVPVFDTTFVTLNRILSAKKIHEGGCDHTSHRLVRLGFSEPRAVLILYFVGLLGALFTCVVHHHTQLAIPVFGAFALLLVCFGVYLTHVAVEEKKPADKTPLWSKIFVGLILKRSFAQLLLDTILIITCLWTAYLLRFDFHLAPFLRQALLQAMPMVVVSCLLGLRLAGAYGGTWRLASMSDVPSYAMGVVIGVSLSISLATFISRFGEGYSRSAYITFAILLFIAISLSRHSFRFLDTFIKKQGHSNAKRISTPVIIYGAGKAGVILLEEILFNSLLTDYTAVGFADDDPNLVGHKVKGLPVKPMDEWKKTFTSPPEIWISTNRISNEQAKKFASLWKAQVRVRRQTLQLEQVL